jgi:hypothetical protein
MPTFIDTYALLLNDLIIATVEAKNVVGYSNPSAENTNGELAQTEPQAPPNAPTKGLTNSNNSQIEVDWLALVNDYTGGSAITNYELLMAVGSGTLADSAFSVITTTTNLTFIKTGLNEGETYQFRYRGVNVHGIGAISTIVKILTADVPVQLASVTTVMSSANVVISWLDTPNARGSAVTEYRIKFKKKDGSLVLNTT